MLTVLLIVVAILVAAGLAYFIVNKTNKGTRTIISVLLWVVILFLGYKIYDGIMAPIEFNKEKKMLVVVEKSLKEVDFGLFNVDESQVWRGVLGFC